MPPPNEKRHAGRQPSAASKIKIPRERTYDAENHDSSFWVDRHGKWWLGDIPVGEVTGRSRKGRNKPPVAVIRLREIERLIAYRLENYGQIPGLEEAQEAAFCFNWLSRGKYEPGLTAWCHVWVPDVLTPAGGLMREFAHALVTMLRGRRLITAKDVCGGTLHLTSEERSALTIQTIWPEGATEQSMEEARRAKRRDNKAARRRQEGVVPRAEYLAKAKARAIAIEQSGMSRRTFYRNRKKDGTSVGTGRDIDIYLADPDLCHPLARAKEASK